MPATSAKQKKFMDAAAHNPAFAKKAGIPVKVAKEFSKASKGQTFKGDEMKESKGMMKKEVSFMKAKGAPKSMVKHEMAEAKGDKKYAFGGMTGKMKSFMRDKVAPAVQKVAASPAVQKAAATPAGKSMATMGGKLGQMATKAMAPALRRGMAAGGNVTKMGSVKTAKPSSGSASSRADGIAQKGKTKGKMLQKGGKAC
jgi:hypothetical protein